MAKTQYYTATSIDGFIADQDNSLEWLFQVEGSSGEDADKVDRFDSFFAGVGAMAMGATTYEWILEHVPEKWQEYYGTTPCWVFTHRDLQPIPGAHLSFVQGDVAAPHARMLDAAQGKNIWLVGGGELVGQFDDRGLLDEILLSVAPVLLGAGAPLLPRRLLSSRLTLVSVEPDERFVHLTYGVAKPTRGDHDEG